jgi:hypothetical protein
MAMSKLGVIEQQRAIIETTHPARPHPTKDHHCRHYNHQHTEVATIAEREKRDSAHQSTDKEHDDAPSRMQMPTAADTWIRSASRRRVWEAILPRES